MAVALGTPNTTASGYLGTVEAIAELISDMNKTCDYYAYIYSVRPPPSSVYKRLLQFALNKAG